MNGTMISLLMIAVIPLSLSAGLYYLFNTGNGKSLTEKEKQITAGVCFGVAAILATELGVPLDGALINVRDAAPLCAGLIFGGQAGIIAGIIGGVERWVSVLWSGAYYTRLACTVSTLLAGFYAAVLRRIILEEKLPRPEQAFLMAVVAEVFHMLMIFLTNVDDVRRAFAYVQACTIPMVLINSLTVMGAVIAIRLIRERRFGIADEGTPGVTDQLHRKMILTVLAGYLLTFLFNYSMQDGISREDIRSLLYLNLEDASEDVVAMTKRNIYIDTRNIAYLVDEETDADILQEIMKRYGIAEINLVGKDGIIFQSSDPQYIGFDMAQNELTEEFLKLLNTEDGFVQELREDSVDGTPRKFSGIATDYGFLEIGLGLDQYHRLIEDGIVSVSDNRHIGENGVLLVLDEDGRIISEIYSNEDNYGTYIRSLDLESTEAQSVYHQEFSGIDAYYMYADVEGYRIVGIYPKTEADFYRNVSIYLTAFIETIIFGILFVVIFLSTKNNVVNKIIDINDSLHHITDGDLNTVVRVGGSREFDSLSNDINSTVDKLKQLIDEANQRIDSELQYAKEIQEAALPSVFPPYPERDEFDIYALMDPAREVGGDFYDLYLLEDDILAFLVADVSGKGIPASLFMMRAKTTLKNMAEGGVSVNDIFTNANYHLCEGNDADMFVTAWMGFLDLKTGELKYANAGHNRPLLRRKDGRYEYLQGPAGFVLAGMDGIYYQEQSLVMEPGDELFLYTDGVVEATNVDKELYGDERLLNCINENLDKDAKGICEAVLADVDSFYTGAPQFDDITELSLRFLKRKEK